MQPDSTVEFLPARILNCVASELAQAWPVLSETTTCGETYEWFLRNDKQPAAAIVDSDGRVKGLINRLRFFWLYAQRYYPELFSRHSIMRLANGDPLVVDEKLSIAEVGSRLIMEQPEALVECFVVTSGGRYLGIGSGEALMRAKVDLLIAHQTHLNHVLLSLQEANRAKSSFLALMSHELRTPLNAIIGFSEVLSSGLFGPLTERYRSYASDIHGAGRHLLALINDILDLSKAEAGRLELHEEELDVSTVVDDCLRLVAERARLQHVSLSSTVASGLPLLVADELRLKQMLLNLLSNGVKFTPGFGSVEIGAGCAGAEFVLYVRDTGVGMAAEAIPVALEPFRQVDSSLARKFEGTGLGLPLVKTLIEAHGGRLEIESAPTKGTEVRLVFPHARVRDRQQETGNRRLSAG